MCSVDLNITFELAEVEIGFLKFSEKKKFLKGWAGINSIFLHINLMSVKMVDDFFNFKKAKEGSTEVFFYT